MTVRLKSPTSDLFFIPQGIQNRLSVYKKNSLSYCTIATSPNFDLQPHHLSPPCLPVPVRLGELTFHNYLQSRIGMSTLGRYFAEQCEDIEDDSLC